MTYLFRPKALEPIAHVWENNDVGPLCRVVSADQVLSRPDRWKLSPKTLGARDCKLCQELLSKPRTS